MYTLKTIARRGTSFGAAVAIAVSAVVPAVFPVMSAYADALNPLTDRSLSLSSSAPGWEDTDGSGNSTYAQPNSGANGFKTGNTFSFKVSSSASVKGISFQYCTGSAGTCSAPGDNGYTDNGDGTFTRNADSDTTSDLNVTTASASQATFATHVTDTSFVTNPTGNVSTIPAASSTGNNYLVYYLDDNATSGDTSDDFWAPSTGWTMTATNNEDLQDPADGTTVTGAATGKNNYITLTKAAGESFTSGQAVKVVFFATDTNYITNPGSGAFFVKINTYSSDSALTPGNVIDGGVTVANVMNQSIRIQTKVLETMDFSVGTVDPNTLESDGTGTSEFAVATGGQTVHAPCDRIVTGMVPGTDVNVLRMGNEGQEDSLSTTKTYSTHSYWRLSSNSSGGATVYYSGVTLSNTVNDQIDAIGPTKAAPLAGKEQFGLALDLDTTTPYATDYDVERDSGKVYENGADVTTSGIHATVATDIAGNPSYHDPQLAPLVPAANYNQGKGNVNSDYAAINTMFAFDTNSNLIPTPLATESTDVVDCVTGKMRYIANIAATTPAGIYTTAINYIAAPQY